MSLSQQECVRLIKDDLYNELRWMLVAASEWNTCEDARKNGTPLQSLPNHLQVLTMDSACVHIRSLYEFFIDAPGKNPRNDTAHAKRDFGISLAPTTLHDSYIESLNKRIFHLDIFRPAPTGRGGVPVNTDLNEKITELSKDILDLWDEFTNQLPAYVTELLDARKKSIAEASKAASSVGGTAIFN